jgi:hypothetical protein
LGGEDAEDIERCAGEGFVWFLSGSGKGRYSQGVEEEEQQESGDFVHDALPNLFMKILHLRVF